MRSHPTYWLAHECRQTDAPAHLALGGFAAYCRALSRAGRE